MTSNLTYNYLHCNNILIYNNTVTTLTIVHYNNYGLIKSIRYIISQINLAISVSVINNNKKIVRIFSNKIKLIINVLINN